MKADAEIYRVTAREIRKDILKMTLAAGATGGHLGGSLSLAELFAVLFSSVLSFDPQDPQWPERDRLVLSKGHGAMALYAAMHQAGLASNEDIASFKSSDHWMTAHTVMNTLHRLEFTGGSLGQGLSFAAGCALWLRDKPCRLFVILGDGECNEGQVWEAAMFASHHALNNITVIVDANTLQYDGKTQDILNMGRLEDKWTAFGWATSVVDGHDVEALHTCLAEEQKGLDQRPRAIIAQTVKGKGISFMENNAQWHQGRLSQKQFVKAMSELMG